jgi:hypothetical protein
LNFIQSQFRFSFDDDIIPCPENIDTKQPIPTAVLESIAIEYTANKYPTEYPVAICDYPLEDELFSSYDEKVALISTHDWEEELSPYPVQSGIAFFLADILLSLYIRTPIHYETRGCPVDYCDKRGDMEVGLSKCDFCSECRSQISYAVSQGQITLQQVVAIYKILDFVAGRKICFALMPFDKKFNRVYAKYIKPIFISAWQCKRADEIYETREIINLIWEQILRADLIIADLTGRNPNVFYELGYAHALGKNTVLITQSINDVPFDLRHRQLVEYSSTPQGCKRLIEAIGKYL